MFIDFTYLLMLSWWLVPLCSHFITSKEHINIPSSYDNIARKNIFIPISLICFSWNILLAFTVSQAWRPIFALLSKSECCWTFLKTPVFSVCPQHSIQPSGLRVICFLFFSLEFCFIPLRNPFVDQPWEPVWRDLEMAGGGAGETEGRGL